LGRFYTVKLTYGPYKFVTISVLTLGRFYPAKLAYGTFKFLA